MKLDPSAQSSPSALAAPEQGATRDQSGRFANLMTLHTATEGDSDGIQTVAVSGTPVTTHLSDVADTDTIAASDDFALVDTTVVADVDARAGSRRALVQESDLASPLSAAGHVSVETAPLTVGFPPSSAALWLSDTTSVDPLSGGAAISATLPDQAALQIPIPAGADTSFHATTAARWPADQNSAPLSFLSPWMLALSGDGDAPGSAADGLGTAQAAGNADAGTVLKDDSSTPDNTASVAPEGDASLTAVVGTPVAVTGDPTAVPLATQPTPATSQAAAASPAQALSSTAAMGSETGTQSDAPQTPSRFARRSRVTNSGVIVPATPAPGRGSKAPTEPRNVTGPSQATGAEPRNSADANLLAQPKTTEPHTLLQAQDDPSEAGKATLVGRHSPSDPLAPQGAVTRAISDGSRTAEQTTTPSPTGPNNLQSPAAAPMADTSDSSDTSRHAWQHDERNHIFAGEEGAQVVDVQERGDQVAQPAHVDVPDSTILERPEAPAGIALDNPQVRIESETPTARLTEEHHTSRAAAHIERIEDIAVALERMRPLPRSGALLEFQTPEMGALRLRVRMVEGTVHVHMDAADTQALQWLTKEQNGLVDAIRSAVPEADSVQLDLSPGGDSHPRQTFHQDEESAPRRYTAGSGAAQHPSNPRPTSQPTPAQPSPRRGLVDIVA